MGSLHGALPGVLLMGPPLGDLPLQPANSLRPVSIQAGLPTDGEALLPRCLLCPCCRGRPLFKELHLLKVKDIFDVQCLKFWYKFVNKKLPNYFRDMFEYNYELHEIGTRSHDQLHLYPTRTSGARNVLKHHIPELLNKFPKYLIDRIKTHSLYSISYNIKCYLTDLYSYNCSIIDCYICNNNNRE